MNLKINQILKYKDSNDDVRVIEVFSQSALLSCTDNHKIPEEIYTFEEIQEAFELPKERWQPKKEGRYYCIGSNGLIIDSQWVNYVVDKKRLDLGNIFKTREEAEQARDKIKELLQNL